MSLALVTIFSSAILFLADTTTGGLPPWASIVLTPTVVLGMFVTGMCVRGKDYEAAIKRAEAWEARCNASEERERETYALAIPAIQASSRVSEEASKVTARVVAYLERLERS